jgi:hypothetical protein
VGAITVPSSGLVYLDANSFIYSVEKHPDFWPLIQPLWRAAFRSVAGLPLVILSDLLTP